MKTPPVIDRAHNAFRTLLAPLARVAALVPDGASVLELGCGQGLVMQALAPRVGRLVGVDYDPRKVRMAQELLAGVPNVEVIEGDILAYLEALEPGTFDCFVLSDTLSSFPVETQDRLLALATSRLGPDGQLILSFVDGEAGAKTLLSVSLSSITYGLRVSRSVNQQFRYRGADELKGVLEAAGCTVERHELHRFPPRPIPHVALVARPRSATPQPVGVTFAILNLRLGGQVSGIVALAEALETRGIQVRFALPEGAASASKRDVDVFAELPFGQRMQRTWTMLQALRPRTSRDVLHLVLPSPAFAPIAATLPWPEDRIVLQYEGPSTHLDAEFAAALGRDPMLMLPRLVLNNAGWAPLARSLRVTHVSPHPAITTQLRSFDFAHVVELANLSVPAAGEAELAPPIELERGHGELWVAYVGHVHPVKGVDLLVDAFERASERRPELRLLLALTRDGRADVLRERVRKSPVSQRMRDVGLVRVASLLADIDALALPYRTALTTTLYPSLLLEGDAAKCPVIVSRLPELAPVLVWDAPGLTVVTPGDRDSLEAALVELRPRGEIAWKPIVQLPPDSERIDAFVRLYSDLTP